MGDSQTGEHLYHRSPLTGVKILSPTSGFLTGGRQWEEEFLQNQTLKVSGIWLQDFDGTGGNRDSTLGGHTQSSVCSGTQEKEQWAHRRLNQTYLLVLEGLLQRGGWPWFIVRRTLAAEVLGSTPWHEPSQSLPLAQPKSLDRIQCWVTSGQTTNREGTQLHPSADKWIKVLLSSGTRATLSSTHHQSLPWGNLHKPLR